MNRPVLLAIAFLSIVPVGGWLAGAASEARKDAFGVSLPPGPPPQRIVSLSPNLTEILFAIEVDRDRIVGVTRFCDYPPEVEGIRRIGGIVDPSVETILALRPDLVLATRGNPTAILNRLRAGGLLVFAFESEDGLDRIYETMTEMLEIVGSDRPERADSLLAHFRDRLACLRAVAEVIPLDERPSVYYYDPVSPDWTAGPGTHVEELIELAGGRNVAADAPAAWPRYAVELLVQRQPDLILVAAPRTGNTEGSVDAILEELTGRPGWRSLRAVRERRICLLPADWVMRPGPRILSAGARLGRCLHPQRNWECDG